MIVKRKKKEEEPSKAKHAIHTAALGYLGGKAGSLTAGAISANNQVQEVGKRIADLPNKIKTGDEQAAKVLQGISSNPRAFRQELIKRSTTSPRTMKAMKLGKRVGIGAGVTLGALSYLKKKKDYDNSKK